MPAAAQPAKLRFALEGGHSRVNAITYTPDGNKIISSGVGSLRFWDVKSGQCTARLSAKGYFKLVSDGQTVTALKFGAVDFWDVKTGKFLDTLDVLDLVKQNYTTTGEHALSRDGQLLAVDYHSGTTYVLDLKTRKILQKVKGAAKALAFSPDGKILAVGRQLFAIESGKQIGEIPDSPGTKHFVGSMDFSPNGKHLAIYRNKNGGDETLSVWDLATFKQKWLVKLATSSTSRNAPLFSPDGKMLCHKNWLYAADTGMKIATFSNQSGSDGPRCFSPDGKTLAFSTGDNQPITLWDLETKKIAGRLPKQGHLSPIECLAFDPVGKVLLSGSSKNSDASVFRWDAASGKFLGVIDLKLAHWGPQPFAISPDGKMVALRTLDYNPFNYMQSGHFMKVASLDTGKELASWRLAGKPNDYFNSWAAFSADGKLLAWNEPREKGKVCVADLTSKEKKIITTVSGGMSQGGIIVFGGSAFSPNGKVLATLDRTDKNNDLTLWNAATGGKIDTIKYTPQAYPCSGPLVFSADGQLLAAAMAAADVIGGHIPKVQVLDVTSKKVLPTLDVHTPYISALAFSPKHKLLAVAGDAPAGKNPTQPIIQLWDLPTKEVIATLEGHVAKINALAFSADGSLLASGDADAGIRVWEINPDGTKEK